MRRVAATAVCAVAIALAAAACGQTVAPQAHTGNPHASAPPASEPARVPHDACADWGYRLARWHIGRPQSHPRWVRKPLPAGFEPVLLITCDEQDRRTPHDGEWTFVVEKHATSGLDPVVAALRSTPPPPPTGEYGCTSDQRLDPWFLLVDRAGHVVLPVVPHDRACDKPIDLGLDKLHYTDVWSKRVQQQATAAEVSTQCPDQYKNLPRMMADDHNSHPASSSVTVEGTPVSVCTYRSSGSDPEIGDFAGGVRLADSDAARIGRLLHAAAPNAGAECYPSGDFAVIHLSGSGDWPYVELSGCERLYVDGGETWTAPVPDLVKALKALHLRR
jgi:hypothetical protein